MGAKPSRTTGPPAPLSVRHYRGLATVEDTSSRPVAPAPKKILLLGASDSGKTTVMKQMQVIYKGGLGGGERSSYKEMVIRNAYAATVKIIEYMRANGLSWTAYTYGNQAADAILKIHPGPYDGFISEHDADALHRMWTDPTTKWIMRERRFEVQFPDCGDYLLDNILRLGKPDYRPSRQDVLMTWSISTGMYTRNLNMGAVPVEVVETSGSRSERRKWINSFSSASLIIFCAPLSEYDQYLREDPNTNRMLESLEIFKHLIHSRWFQNASFVLLLTKADIFHQKILKVPLSDYFPDYTGEHHFESAVQYIKNRYLALQTLGSARLLNCYVLNATDTAQVENVFTHIQTSFLDDIGARTVCV